MERKKLLALSKPQLIKKLKENGVKPIGNKNEMINALLQKIDKENEKKKIAKPKSVWHNKLREKEWSIVKKDVNIIHEIDEEDLIETDMSDISTINDFRKYICKKYDINNENLIIRDSFGKLIKVNQSIFKYNKLYISLGQILHENEYSFAVYVKDEVIMDNCLCRMHGIYANEIQSLIRDFFKFKEYEKKWISKKVSSKKRGKDRPKKQITIIPKPKYIGKNILNIKKTMIEIKQELFNYFYESKEPLKLPLIEDISFKFGINTIDDNKTLEYYLQGGYIGDWDINRVSWEFTIFPVITNVKKLKKFL